MGAAVKATLMSVPQSVKWLNLLGPVPCLIVINLLESHYLGTPITNDRDSDIKRLQCIFKTSEAILRFYSCGNSCEAVTQC